MNIKSSPSDYSFISQSIGSQLCIDTTTVDSHRKNMLAKYNVGNTSALIQLALTEGMIAGNG